MPHDWSYDEIKEAYEAGLMTGTSAVTFSPNGLLTRGQAVTILWRLEGEPSAAAPAAFVDVVPGAYYAEAAAWANEVGVVRGIESANGLRFAPDDYVTREQFAAIIYRYADYKGVADDASGYAMNFVDVAEVSDWAYEAMQWCAMHRIINGMDGNRLVPKGTATRAQAAAILNRTAELVK